MDKWKELFSDLFIDGEYGKWPSTAGDLMRVVKKHCILRPTKEKREEVYFDNTERFEFEGGGTDKMDLDGFNKALDKLLGESK